MNLDTGAIRRVACGQLLQWGPRSDLLLTLAGLFAVPPPEALAGAGTLEQAQLQAHGCCPRPIMQSTPSMRLEASDCSKNWSPDGAFLLLTHRRAGPHPISSQRAEVYAVSPCNVCSRVGTFLIAIPRKESVLDFAWAPDSGALAVLSSAPNAEDCLIQVIRVDTLWAGQALAGPWRALAAIGQFPILQRTIDV